jgi:hypothetical protein
MELRPIHTTSFDFISLKTLFPTTDYMSRKDMIQPVTHIKVYSALSAILPMPVY